MKRNEKISARKKGSNKVYEHLRKLEQLLLTVRVNGEVLGREMRWHITLRPRECTA
jgi:predicted  nucleic acid-binding Zn ribbon protein